MLSFVKPLVFFLISFSCYSKDTPDNWLGNRFLLQPVLYLYLVNLTINSSAKALTHMHFCCHLLLCWCCLTFTTDDAKSAEIAFCSLMGPPLPKCSSRIQFITFLWIGCANNIIRYISAWKKPCFYHCFSSIFLQWIGWLVSNILYWCWEVSPCLLVRFSSCFIYLIRNFLLKKIIMKTHFLRLENYLQAILKSSCRFQIFLGFSKTTLWAQCETLLLEMRSPGGNALGRHHLGWVHNTIWNSIPFGDSQDRHPKLLSFLEGKLIPYLVPACVYWL